MANVDLLKQIMASIDAQSQTATTLCAQVKALDARVNDLNTALTAEQKAHSDNLAAVNAALQKTSTQITNNLPTLSPLGQAATSAKQPLPSPIPPPAPTPTPPAATPAANGSRRAVPN